MARRLHPLTERILERLPGSRLLWIALWTLVPWLNAGANLLLDTDAKSAVWEQSGVIVAINYAALSFGVALTLWGTNRIARRLETLGPFATDDASTRFSRLNSSAGPLLASAATAFAFGVSAFARDGWAAALLRGGTWFVLGVAFWTFLWTYAVLHVGLDRLGRERVVPQGAPGDPTLGLRPLGAVAFMGLWMLLAWIVPVVVTGLPDIVGVVVGVLVLAGGLAAYFLSLFRLHLQMVEVKSREVEIARQLYGQAYEPVRARPTLDALERQQRLLSAADTLEKRARAIHEWPIDEGTVARVITIVTSVIAITIGRLILDPLGL